MRLAASLSGVVLFVSIHSALTAQTLVIRAVVNDSSPDGRLCPECYATIHYTPTYLSFTASSVSVLINGAHVFVNIGGDSDDLLQGGSFRVLIPSTVTPGPGVVTMATTAFG